MKKTILLLGCIFGLFLAGCGESAEKMYRKGNHAKGTDEKIQWYEKAAKRGHAVAQVELGIILRDEKGDFEKAEKWLRKAAASNDENAKSRANINLRTLDSMKRSGAREREMREYGFHL